MTTNAIVEAWKNPKKRNQVDQNHPSGAGFQELTVEEMNFIAGGNGSMEPQATPATPATPIISKVSWAASGAAASFVVSFVASAATKCSD